MKAEMLVWTGEWHQSVLSGLWCFLNLCGWNYPQGMCRGKKSSMANHMEPPQNISDIKATLKGWKVYDILTKCGWSEEQKPGFCAILGDSTCWTVFRGIQWIVSRIQLSVVPNGECRGVLSQSCPSLWGNKLSTGPVWYYLWEWHQANYTGFQSIFPFLYEEEKNPKQEDYCSECLKVVMGDHSAGLCVGDDRSVLAWLPLFLLQPPLPCLVLHPCTKTHEVTCKSDQHAETICFLAMSVYCRISLFTQLTLLLQSLKLIQGSFRSVWLGKGRYPLSVATGQGTTKSITGAGVPVIRVERKCRCENEAGFKP